MFGNPIGAKGAQKHQASITAKTGSFLVIQAMVSSSAIQAEGTGEAAAADGVNSHISQSGAYAKFTNIKETIINDYKKIN